MTEDPIKIMQYVNTGEVSSGGTDTLFNSGAIGSCVVTTAFDRIKSIGAMAHIMLPGTAPLKNQSNDTIYAVNAIEEMIIQLKSYEVKNEDIEICLVGGANVLKRENDSIGKDNLDFIQEFLREKHLEIKASETGGLERRTVMFDIMKGCVYYTVGDSKQKILWQTENK